MGIKSFLRGGSQAGRGDQPSFPPITIHRPMDPKDYTWEEQLRLRDAGEWITGNTKDYGNEGGSGVMH